MIALQIDNNREWVQWYIEDEEGYWDWERWVRENVRGWRPTHFPRGVIETEIGGDLEI